MRTIITAALAAASLFVPVSAQMSAETTGTGTGAGAVGGDRFGARYGLTQPTTVSPYLSIPGLVAGEVRELDGTAALHRGREGIGYTASVRGLEPGAAYTNWFVVFTRPEACETACACGLGDLTNEAARVGVYYATGRVADPYGQASFASETGYGELPDGEDQVPLEGLDAPLSWRSEVHLVVRRHARASDDPAALEAQLSTFGGGCPEEGCQDEQVSVHRSPFCKARWGRR